MVLRASASACLRSFEAFTQTLNGTRLLEQSCLTSVCKALRSDSEQLFAKKLFHKSKYSSSWLVLTLDTVQRTHRVDF